MNSREASEPETPQSWTMPDRDSLELPEPAWWERFIHAPFLGLAISLLVHTVCLLILAKITTTLIQPDPTVDVQSMLSEIPEVPEFDEIELEPLDIDKPLDIQSDLSTDVQNPVPDAFTEIPNDKAESFSPINMPSINSMAQLLSGNAAGGMAARGKGGGGLSATFFGLRADGNRFVYVVDNSGSMGRAGRFQQACEELVRSITQLKDDQRFFVIFFSDQPYPMFFPKMVREPIPATPSNIDRLREWIATVKLVMRTDAQASMALAFRMNPDAIFLLTDGEFTDNTQRFLMKRPGAAPIVNTIGFQIGESITEKRLQAIARQYRGRYQLVKAKKLKPRD